jgi:hypothetical protein
VAYAYIDGRPAEIGRFPTEKAAAIARDRVVLHERGSRAKLNLAGREPDPASLDQVREECRRANKAQTTSRFRGVVYRPGTRGDRCWAARLQLKRATVENGGRLGFWASEEEAAMAYDRAALYYRDRFGAAVELNYPDRKLVSASAEQLWLESERERKAATTSRFRGVTWDASKSVWIAQIRGPGLTRQRKLGTFAREEDAARAYDRASIELRGDDARLNFDPETAEVAGGQRLRLLRRRRPSSDARQRP